MEEKDDHRVGDAVYVRDEAFAWLPGRIIKVFDSEALVNVEYAPDWDEHTDCRSERTPRKENRLVSLSEYPDSMLPFQNQKAVEDLADLCFPHEAAILYQLKERHSCGKPYARAGGVLVSTNPCKNLPDLYSLEVQTRYAQHFIWGDLKGLEDVSTEKTKEGNPPFADLSQVLAVNDRRSIEPHAYEISALSYRGLLSKRKNQTIFVTGESGSGKTETAKFLLEHLMTIEKISPFVNEPLVNGVAVTDIVSASSCVLEAFGNASILRNRNSSRFGKVTRLQYYDDPDSILRLRGGHIECFLLEATRAVAQLPGEQSFHIFYQILSAPRKDKKDLLGDYWVGAKVSDFRCLNTSGDEEEATVIANKEMWQKTSAALGALSCTSISLKELFQAIGIILRLGNMRFEDSPSGTVSIPCRQDLFLLSDSLRVSMDQIEWSLTHQKLKVGEETVYAHSSADEAKAACDALAKKIYEIVFLSLVEKVNSLMRVSPVSTNPRLISVVDLCGMEKFYFNHFEQLCVNYAQEEMQHKYIHDNIQKCIQRYQQEGIQIHSTATDNSDILALFEGPGGVLACLVQECKRPNASDENFVAGLKHFSKENPCFAENNIDSKLLFSVHHYAGTVSYDASNFVESNIDKLPPIILELGAATTNQIIGAKFRQLLGAEDNQEGGAQKLPTTLSVVEKFRLQLKRMLNFAQKDKVYHIRCVKPNEDLLTSKVQHSTLLRQISCASLSMTAELSKRPYPHSLKFAEAIQHFSCLVSEDERLNVSNLEVYDQVQYILTRAFLSASESCNGNVSMPFFCGKTKVFFREGALDILRSRRERGCRVSSSEIQGTQKRHEHSSNLHAPARGLDAIIGLQKWYRAATCRRHYINFRNAVLSVQAFSRRCSAQECYRTVIARVVRCQAWSRSVVQRYKFLAIRRYSVCIQSVVRMHLERKVALQRRKATVVAENFPQDSFVDEVDQLKQESDRKADSTNVVMYVVQIQNWYMAITIRNQYLKARAAVITLQAFSRMLLAKGSYTFTTAQVTQCQAWVRGVLQRTTNKTLHFDPVESSELRQPVEVHNRQMINHLDSDRSAVPLAAVRIQTWYRSCVLRNQITKLRKAAVQVQAFSRMVSVKVLFNAFLGAIIRYQAFSRMLVSRRSFLSAKRAALSVQTIIRMILARKQFLGYKTSAVRLQKFFRKRKETLATLNMVFRLQTWYRAMSQRKLFTNLRKAAVRLQAISRMREARLSFRRLITTAIQVQAVYRRVLQRKTYGYTLKGVVTIQAAVRRLLARHAFSNCTASILRLQSFVRSYRAKEAERIEKENVQTILRASVSVQKWYRRTYYRRRYITMKSSVVRIQTFFRLVSAKTFLQKQVSVIIQFQSSFRGRMHRKRYALIRRSILVLQVVARHYLTRKSLACQRSVSALQEDCYDGQDSIESQRDSDSSILNNTPIAQGTHCNAIIIDDLEIKNQPCQIENEEPAKDLEIVVVSESEESGEPDPIISSRGADVIKPSKACPNEEDEEPDHTFSSTASSNQFRDIPTLDEASFPIDSFPIKECYTSEIEFHQEKVDESTKGTSFFEVPLTKPQFPVEEIQWAEMNPGDNLEETLSMSIETHSEVVQDEEHHDAPEQQECEREEYLTEICNLREELQHVSEEAAMHQQEVLEDFEERLGDYESEVLQLKDDLQVMQSKNAKLKKKLELAKAVYLENVSRLQANLVEVHEVHQNNEKKMNKALKAVNAARAADAERSSKDFAATISEKNRAIADLQSKVQLLSMEKAAALQSIDDGSFEVYLSPDYILATVDDAYSAYENPEEYVERMISSKVRNAMAFASFSKRKSTETIAIVNDSEDEVAGLQQQLVWAYEEIERLQTEAGKATDGERSERRVRKLNPFGRK